VNLWVFLDVSRELCRWKIICRDIPLMHSMFVWSVSSLHIHMPNLRVLPDVCQGSRELCYWKSYLVFLILIWMVLNSQIILGYKLKYLAHSQWQVTAHWHVVVISFRFTQKLFNWEKVYGSSSCDFHYCSQYLAGVFWIRRSFWRTISPWIIVEKSQNKSESPNGPNYIWIRVF